MGSRVPFSPLPIEQSDVVYEPGPDSTLQPGVPAGRTTHLELDGRSIWVHVPARTRPDDVLACTVFQDGAGFLDPEDDLRSAIVLDNLVHAGHIPPMVGIFVDPAADRNAEYDAFDGRYADFLVAEVLPLVGEVVRLSDDPRQRALCGFSSGGSASLTAAWHRPDAFGRVLGFVSSFAQMIGGNPFPRLVAASPARPLRVLLQEGHRDLGWDEPEHNWLAENLRVAAALAEGGYDVRLVLGDGGHDPNHAGVLLPDALRWTWRDQRATPVPGRS
jgi:enterochelin esterase-like enzyme